MPVLHARELRAGADSIDKRDLIDRLQKACPENCEASELRELSRWVHGYQLKWGRDKHAHAPDAHVLSQLLAVAPLPRLISLITDLMQERKEPGYSYGWYVTVAIQRIHGIHPKALAAERAALRAAPRRGASAESADNRARAAAGPAAADPQWGRDLLGELEGRRKKWR
jgi:hypothetical protein